MATVEQKTAEILTPFGDYKTPLPSQKVIQILERALHQAQRGDVVGVALAVVDGRGFVSTRAERGTRGMAEMVGAVAVMQDDLIRLWKNENDG